MEKEINSADFVTAVDRLDFGKSEHGCEHYRRRCKIRAPCCDQIFFCRHCHNAAMGESHLGGNPYELCSKSDVSNPKDRHEIVRHDVSQVICAVCDTEQQVAQVCFKCGVKMGEYFCGICKFYDDDTTKEQFHCDECGICRVGGREKFFHCKKCASCFVVDMQDNHSCVENSMKNQCPICYEYLFDSLQKGTVMKCGHTIHMDCLDEMIAKNQYRCPICSKSVCDMSRHWELLGEEIAATAMPEEYHYEVKILCNDCNNTSEAPFHIFGHKCGQCNSYNTRVVGGNNRPQPQTQPDESS